MDPQPEGSAATGKGAWVITTRMCIGATFRLVHIVGASRFGLKVRVEDGVEPGAPVTLTHAHREPLGGRICWTEGVLARIEFDQPLSEGEFDAWFSDMI